MPKHEFFVDMTCEGCSNAVTRVLNKLGGVQFEIDLPSKKVSIESDHSVDALLETLKKTGKNASYIGANPCNGFRKKIRCFCPSPCRFTTVALPDVERRANR